MPGHILLLFGISCLMWPSALGHAVPRKAENMNGHYLISNPNHATENSHSTLYSDRPNVEYFDAYSPPISTRYRKSVNKLYQCVKNLISPNFTSYQIWRSILDHDGPCATRCWSSWEVQGQNHGNCRLWNRSGKNTLISFTNTITFAYTLISSTGDEN